MEQEIYKLVNDQKLVEEADEFIKRIIPISIALARAQRDSSTIEIWYKLEQDLKHESSYVLKYFQSRQKMALEAVHFLANMIDHRFRVFHLSESQKAAAYEYLGTLNEDILPIFMSHCIGEAPFPKYVYSAEFRKTRPITW